MQPTITELINSMAGLRHDLVGHLFNSSPLKVSMAPITLPTIYFLSSDAAVTVFGSSPSIGRRHCTSYRGHARVVSLGLPKVRLPPAWSSG